MALPGLQPTHLEPSVLGTQEYWDEYYERDLDDVKSGQSLNPDDEEAQLGDDGWPEYAQIDPTALESWFDDVGAPEKTFDFLTSESFPLSPNFVPKAQNTQEGSQHSSAPSVLDLGTGNGSSLWALRLQGDYKGMMVGVDYSQKSIDLAQRIEARYWKEQGVHARGVSEEIFFKRHDIIRDPATYISQWNMDRSNPGFDLVLDKGTFDAISLSNDRIVDNWNHRPVRICERYPQKILQLVKMHGYLLVTSCNWTEEELIAWFTRAHLSLQLDDKSVEKGKARFEVYHKIEYRVYQFGGQKGQGVASVCFKKVPREEK